ncbi:MAG: TonB-dependent receptor [Pseudomonadota bacterium]
MGIEGWGALRRAKGRVFAVALALSASMMAPSMGSHAQAHTQAQAPGGPASQTGRPVRFDIPGGRLSSAIRALARQAGISVASRERGLRRLQAKPLRGTFAPADALRRLLTGTPYRAVAMRGGFRIEKRPKSTPTAPAAVRAKPAVSRAPPPGPILVEATKRALTASDYPGGIKLVTLDDPFRARSGESLDAALADIPSVSGTALGSGRNKVFLRGIADSSFNGPTPSTIGLYLGEQRLIFSAPNPDLRLHDTDTVELLEGPQGTLYGAGTIAGLLRVNPRAPDPSGLESEAWLASGFTRQGGFNWDAGGMANLPVSQDAALRVVGYGGEESGYIDDPRLGLDDINAGSHYGARAALSVAIGPDWEVELSGFGQHSEADNGQYIDTDLEGLARSDRVAQPFRGRIYGGAVTVRAALGDMELTSSTGVTDHSLFTVFDSSTLTANQPDSPTMDGPAVGSNGAAITSAQPGMDTPLARQAFRESREIRLLTHETRLSGGASDSGGWLVGVSVLRNRDRMEQLFENVDPGSRDPPPFADLTYRLDEIALFGEGSAQIAPQWSVTGGARLLHTSASGQRSFGPDTLVEPREGPVRLLPALALAWRPDEGWMAYARAQQGFRTGGVTIERDPEGNPQTAQFDPDKVRSYEAGLRARLGDRAPVEIAVTVHHSDWSDIQADILDLQGFPLTRNIGDGSVTGADATLTVQTPKGWDLSLAAAWNDSGVDRILPDGAIRSVAIPNVPDFSAHARLGKRWSLGPQAQWGAVLAGRYVGRSFLDLDQMERVEQGDYGELDAALWYTQKAVTVRLEALNVTDTRGNLFAFGNPFTARAQDQATPLRPITLRFKIQIKR